MKRHLIKQAIPLLLAGISAACLSCDFFSSAGALFISEDDEVQVGTEFDAQLRSSDSAKAEYPIFVAKNHADTVFESYVKGLAQEILDAIPAGDKPSYPFKFTIIDADVVNAFAVPGGYVYIYTGIIKQMQDESELAGVLGHELTHVTKHHYRDAMAKEAGLQLLVQALVGNDAGQLTQLVAGSLFQLASLKVTRDNETEADHYGTINIGRVNRNPLGIAKFFSRLPSSALEDWISTHPAPATRVEAVNTEVQNSTSLSAVAADSAVTNYRQRFLDNTAAMRATAIP